MAILRAEEIRKLGEKELDEKILELNKELMKVKSQIATGAPPENPGRVKEIRRTLARIKTLTKKREVKE